MSPLHSATSEYVCGGGVVSSHWSVVVIYYVDNFIILLVLLRSFLTPSAMHLPHNDDRVLLLLIVVWWLVVETRFCLYNINIFKTLSCEPALLRATIFIGAMKHIDWLIDWCILPHLIPIIPIIPRAQTKNNRNALIVAWWWLINHSWQAPRVDIFNDKGPR